MCSDVRTVSRGDWGLSGNEEVCLLVCVYVGWRDERQVGGGWVKAVPGKAVGEQGTEVWTFFGRHFVDF